MNIEYAILNLIQSMSSPFLDSFFSSVTHLGDGGFIWIVTGVLLIIYGGVKKKRRVLLCGFTLLLALLFGFIGGNLTLKPIIARPRPYEGLDIPLLIKAPSDFSFPSGHTLSSFAASVSIFLYNRKYGAAAIILACVIAFSRLYLYVHFPSDILFGTVLGIVCAFAAKYTVTKIHMKRVK